MIRELAALLATSIAAPLGGEPPLRYRHTCHGGTFWRRPLRLWLASFVVQTGLTVVAFWIPAKACASHSVAGAGVLVLRFL